MKRFSPLRLAALAWVGICLGILGGPRCAQAASEKVIHEFKPTAGNPDSPLISVGGALYGTTNGFGLPSKIFKVTPAGKVHTVATLNANFGFNSGLLAVGKLLYGVAQEGNDPTCFCGYVFSATEKGEITILHTFTGGSDGAAPSDSLIELGGVLYGTTRAGGTGACSESSSTGCGTVFAITPQGAYTQIYAFQGPASGDGELPGALTAVNGILYGTTYSGGTAPNQAFSGTLFSLSTQGVETVLHSFGMNKKDASGPDGGLLQVGRTLYGTTATGGVGASGTAFSIGLDGSHEKILHAFANDGTDGVTPGGGMVALNGLFYGLTGAGGTTGYGTVFSLTEKGDEAVVYTFQGGADALYPNPPLLAVEGSLYGTSLSGGHYAQRCYTRGCGTVFEITP